MAETPEEKIRRLEEKIAKDAEAVRRPRQILYERNRLKAKVEKFSADIEKLTTSLEGLKSDRKGVMEAMVEVDVFLNKLGVEVRHRWPLFRLLWALEDLDYGIINPITDKSTRVGQPLPSQEVALKTWACLAVIGLCATGTKKGKAYDIVAEASGLPRGKLKQLNQTGKKEIEGQQWCCQM